MKRENLIYVAEAMKFPEVVRLVENASRQIWYKVKDETSFEYICYRNIGKALVEDDVKSVTGLAYIIISKAAGWCIKNRPREKFSYIEDLAHNPDEEDVRIEVLDELADVESEVMANEMVAFLAEGDQRNEMILNAWKYGEFNFSAIAKDLAESFAGTKAESHRKHIQRFRSECERVLASVV